MENNELAIAGSIRDELSTDSSNSWCSISPTSDAERKLVFNAMNAPKYNVSDFINKQINVKDVYVEEVSLTSEETGEMYSAPRIVLIDVDGNGYQTISQGILSALKNAFYCYGVPTWEDGLPIVIKQVSVKRGSMLTFDVA